VKLCLGCGAEFDRPDWNCPVCPLRPGRRGDTLLFAEDLAHGDGSDAEYCWDDLIAAEERHFWFRTRRRLVLWAIGRYFTGARSLFDVGCGTGFVLEGVRRGFPAIRLTGGDVRLRWVEEAAPRLVGVPVLQVDARRLPFRGEFDVACALDILEHIEDDERVLGEMYRALRPGGGVLVTVPQHPWLWSAVDEFSRHKRRYTRRGLAAKLQRAGFAEVRLTSFFSFLLPALALARLRRRRVGDFDPADELRVSRPVNGILASLSSIEQLLLRASVSLPAGGSLLAVARRLG
jgi:SAM-dependent methyltransferase